MKTYQEQLIRATEENRIENLSVHRLKELINQMKGMESFCRQRCEYQMETFYHNAKIGYQKRLDRLVEQSK